MPKHVKLNGVTSVSSPSRRIAHGSAIVFCHYGPHVWIFTAFGKCFLQENFLLDNNSGVGYILFREKPSIRNFPFHRGEGMKGR